MDIKPIIEKIYPEGSAGGQCGDFAHKLIDFPSIGDSYSQKKKSVQQYGILRDYVGNKFRRGDVVITDEGTFLGIGSGHVATILDPKTLAVVESNYFKDGKVHYGRKVQPNRIYGVIRGAYKFPLDLPKLLTLKICLLMNYKKPWGAVYPEMLQEWFYENSNRTVKLEIFPLYTNFTGITDQANYKAEGVNGPNNYYFYNVPSREWLKDTVMPLRFASDNQLPDLTILCVSKQDWRGSVFNADGAAEIGYYYAGDDMVVLQVDEGDVSMFHYGLPAFVDYLIHEMSHWLYDKALDYSQQAGTDRTHYYYQLNQMDKIFNDINLKQLMVNKN
ncbi:MAG: hypothetical protein M1383_06300 [Patescibacteria group bacterium]|nr:hypothetical protein [Patescibacteria group bacterium]